MKNISSLGKDWVPASAGTSGKRKRIARVCGGLIAAFAIAATAAIIALGPLPTDQLNDVSTTVVDRNGKLLRAYAMEDGRWRLPVKAAQVDPTYLKLLLAFEDKRFYDHHGVDPLAVGRAALQLASTGHIVSGGSTISMQL